MLIFLPQNLSESLDFANPEKQAFPEIVIVKGTSW